MNKILCIIFFIKLLYSYSISDITQSNDDYRLLGESVPLSYNILMETKINYDNFKFNGNITITLRAVEDVKYVVLHLSNSTIESIQMRDKFTKNIIPICNYTINSKTEKLTVFFSEKLIHDEIYELEIIYSGDLRSDKLGFYRSSYINDNNDVIWLAATQFAPVQARHAFPCYDEPHLKATFNIAIRHPKKFRAISNMRVKSIEDKNDFSKTTIFEETPKMSTYLIGFVISDLDYIEKIDEDSPRKLEQHVYARSNAIQYANFSSNFAFDVFRKFQTYFSAEYPFNLMQHVAIPDFHFSGMENWGITTYRESRFLFVPGLYSVNSQIDIVTLVSHEMAHQWFGNLVTMEWWKYVWLKEGFASLYEYYGPQMVLENLNSVELFIARKLQYVMTIDSDPSIRPMSHDVKTQKEIMENYDKIAYDKSACVLRMMEHAVTPEIFKIGIDYYLENRKYASANEDHLFESISRAINDKNFNFPDIMGTWTRQSGYPLLRVIRDDEKNTLTLCQERFLFESDENNSKNLWWIPLNFASAKSLNFNVTNPDYWLPNVKCDQIQLNTVFKDLTSTDWIILNKQQTGYYRILYDIKNWQLLQIALRKNHSIIHIHNRAQLIDDAFNLAFANKLSYPILLNLINYMNNEYDYAPWSALNAGFSTFRRLLSDDKEYYLLLNYMQKLLDEPYQVFSVQDNPNEAILRKLTRQIVVSLACEVGLENCLNEIFNYGHPNMRSVYYCNRLRQNDFTVLPLVINQLENINDTIIRSEAISSLSCIRNELLLWKILKRILVNESHIKYSEEEKLQFIKNIYQKDSISFRSLIKFLQSYINNVINHLTEKSIKELIVDSSKYVNSVKSHNLFNEMLKKLKLIGTVDEQTEIKAGINIKQNLEWISKNRNTIMKSLKLSISK